MKQSEMIFAQERIDWEYSVYQLRDCLRRHGVLGEGIPPEVSRPRTQLEKMVLVRALFLLIPRLAVTNSPDAPEYIKPLVRDHLQSLEINADEELVEILKRVSDQIKVTDPNNPSQAKKMGIGDLRARNKAKYLAIRKMQNQRCNICGVALDLVQPELDHVIPWRFIGDIPDGSNWQILCNLCNNAKKEYLSSFQLAEAWNWVYKTVAESIDSPTNSTRFAVLANSKGCGECGKGRNEVQLEVVSASPHGLFVTEHLKVLCKECK